MVTSMKKEETKLKEEPKEKTMKDIQTEANKLQLEAQELHKKKVESCAKEIDPILEKHGLQIGFQIVPILVPRK